MVDMDTIVSLCKRRGFVFPSSDIYGGLASTYDYGPLGVEMKRNIRDSWWRTFIQGRDDCVGIESAILMHPDVWRTSGHLANFADPLVECKSCNHRFRADHLAGRFSGAGFRRLDFSDATLSLLTSGQRQFIVLAPFVLEVAENGLIVQEFNLTWRNLGGTSNDTLSSVQQPVLPGNYVEMRPLRRGDTLYRGAQTYVAIFEVTGQSVDENLEIHFTTSQNSQLRERVDLVGRLNSPVRLISPAVNCPDCGGSLGESRQFNLMLKTFLGAVEDNAAVAYLRPETAQGIFVNFLNVLTATRRKLPFGIGQQGKSFRNEITVGNFIFRTREFEQMELEFFVQPGTDDEWHQTWIKAFVDWFHGMGIAPDKLRVRAHEKAELSHYSKATSDIEYAFPWGWGELMGIANRTDFDLKAHAQATGVKLEYFDDETKQHVVPYVIEPACGVDRILLTLLINAYDEQDVPAGDGKTEKRVVVHLHPSIAPVKVTVLPLSRNARLTPKAREVYDLVRKTGFATQYDDAQSIGRRYRRQDEIGTPLCVTVDFQTVESDNAVTIRDRDTMQQERVPVSELVAALHKKLA